MPRFLFAYCASLLPQQWQRDRFARVALHSRCDDPARLSGRIANLPGTAPLHV